MFIATVTMNNMLITAAALSFFFSMRSFVCPWYGDISSDVMSRMIAVIASQRRAHSLPLSSTEKKQPFDEKPHNLTRFHKKTSFVQTEIMHTSH